MNTLKHDKCSKQHEIIMSLHNIIYHNDIWYYDVWLYIVEWQCDLKFQATCLVQHLWTASEKKKHDPCRAWGKSSKTAATEASITWSFPKDVAGFRQTTRSFFAGRLIKPYLLNLLTILVWLTNTQYEQYCSWQILSHNYSIHRNKMIKIGIHQHHRLGDVL